MTTSRPARPVVAVAALAVLALAGCSSSGDDGGSKGGGSRAEWTPGPLDEYQARIYGFSYDDERSEEEMQEESERQNRKVEELVASCMQDQGFDYTPVDNSGSVGVSSDDLDVEWGTREFAEQYGYAISTDPWGNADAAPEEETEWVDPNQEYVESMSESEAAAYQEALWGPQVEYVEGEEQEYDWTTSGCYGVAQHEVYEGGVDSDEFSAVEDELNRFYETMQADPRIAELNTEWASCMADEGYDGITDVSTVQNDLSEEWNELQGWNDPEYTALSESWDWEAKPEGPPAPEVDEKAAAAFTDKEIAMAVADFDCQEKVDYVGKGTTINHELQQEFVDQHKAELDAWADAATAARGE